MKNYNINYKLTEKTAELQQILELQAKNLLKQLSEDDKIKQGFVTVQHNLEILQNMHLVHPHIIAVSGNTLVGYALSMSKKFKQSIPALAPMFAKIDQSEKANENYLIMGQVCIAKEFREQGIFRKLYAKMKEVFSKMYSCIITEINVLNTRSLKAHSAIGFKELMCYQSNNQTWLIVFLEL
ncbi:MAG: GNAT family N-acetyltransferase [Tenacibaculum sp.]